MLRLKEIKVNNICAAAVQASCFNDLKCSYNLQMSVDTLYTMMHDRELNPDPIEQRPPTSSKNTKSIEIITALQQGISSGFITVRDISNDIVNKELYRRTNRNVIWNIIDGGHRSRALRDYIDGRFEINGKSFRDLSREEKAAFKQIVIPICIYECTNLQATQIFRSLNKSTPIKEMETIMASSVSTWAEVIRKKVKFYFEYDNEIHPIFSTTIKKRFDDGYTTMKPRHWDGADINPRWKWGELVAISYIKTILCGNYNSGLDNISMLVDHGKITQYIKGKAGKIEKIEREQQNTTTDIEQQNKQFWDTAYDVFVENGTKKINEKSIAAFMVVYFTLLEKLNDQGKSLKWKKEKLGLVHERFSNVHALLTGNTKNDYDKKTEEFPSGSRVRPTVQDHFVKEFMRRAVVQYANEAEQQAAGEYYLKLMNIDDCYNITEKTRGASPSLRQETLALQEHKCWVDGKSLKIEDAEFAHDTPHCEGGELKEGRMVRRVYNQQGIRKLDEIRQEHLNSKRM